ncbi:MAG: hypothetical protein ACUBOA_09755 [Candidatus Loosdrechtia sp.]|uniref:hypothetical protein n=1 Tax=Candidatus Loosdrechtia sp. TaxID=3101272 RepID=UPI003A6E9C15|nr:MAG: hypothetical protein QY305_11465 [Candidatus Jettenia sp. AMX2]
MDVLKKVAELKEFLGQVYCFIEENEDSFKNSVEAEKVKAETWKWMEELAKFLPEM